MKNSIRKTFGVKIDTKYLNPKATAARYCANGAVNAACSTSAGKEIVHRVASAVAGKRLAGAAAQNVMKKTLRSNPVVNSAMFVVETIPDAYKACTGKMSGKKFAKKATGRAAEFGGAAVGTSWGASIGTMVCPGVGTVVGGFVGSVAGSIATSSLFRKIF